MPYNFAADILFAQPYLICRVRFSHVWSSTASVFSPAAVSAWPRAFCLVYGRTYRHCWGLGCQHILMTLSCMFIAVGMERLQLSAVSGESWQVDGCQPAQTELKKSEVIWVGSKSTVKQRACPALQIGTSSISASDSVRPLGVLISADLSFHRHVTNVAGQCFYQLRQLRFVRESLDADSDSGFCLESCWLLLLQSTRRLTANSNW